MDNSGAESIAMGSAIAGHYQEAARLEVNANRCDDRF
jgi:hypothetical protein